MSQPEEAGVPPANKRSMVSENLDVKAVADKARKEMEKPDFMPSNDVLLLFAVEKLHDIAVSINKLTELVDVFKKVADQSTQSTAPKPVVTASTPKPAPVKQTVAPTPTASVVTPTPTPTVATTDSPRLIEVKEKLKEFLNIEEPLITVDEAESAQFILVRPKKFLGGNNFSRIASIIRELGGVYVSQGQASHFKVPKLKK